MNLLRSFGTWRRYRETVSELSRLSQHELDDLGIQPHNIREVARRAARR